MLSKKEKAQVIWNLSTLRKETVQNWADWIVSYYRAVQSELHFLMISKLDLNAVKHILAIRFLEPE